MLRAGYLVAFPLPVLAFAQTPRDHDSSGMMPDHHSPGMMPDRMGGMMHAVRPPNPARQHSAPFRKLSRFLRQTLPLTGARSTSKRYGNT
jgi:hypothetical protein